jgi:HAD superfamily phosphoserine phosphatase-like hydrolase
VKTGANLGGDFGGHLSTLHFGLLGTSMSRLVCLSDWDGTLRKGYTALDWVMFLEDKSLLPPGSANRLHSIFELHRKSLISYESLVQKVANAYGNMLTGHSCADICAASTHFVATDFQQLYEFTMPLINLMREFSIEIVLITGCPAHAISEYAKHLGVSKLFGTTYQTHNGVFTGDVQSNFGIAERKAEAVLEATQSSKRTVLAIGDSTSDMPLFEKSEISLFVGDTESIVSPVPLVGLSENGYTSVLDSLRARFMRI